MGRFWEHMAFCVSIAISYLMQMKQSLSEVLCSFC